MSEITSFFNGKTIFLTGATGTIGKLLIDQLLRKCEPKKLYLLIRCKKDFSLNSRAQKLFQEDIFERLREEKPFIFEKVRILNGDLTESRLGINEELTKELTENVEIVIHSAATVRFDESLRMATNVNVKGTMSIIKLCHQIENLKAFVYISTAFSNCHNTVINEELYDIHISCDKLVALVETLNDNQLNNLQKKILGKWYNTYVFSKAIAESAIKTYAENLPVAIIRPSIVTGTVNEPIPGWPGDISAVSLYVIGTALGVFRTALACPEALAELIPGDKVANCILAITYKTGHLGSRGISVYNVVTNKNNKIPWNEFIKLTVKSIETLPPERMFWPPSLLLQSNAVLYEILSVFLNLVPAFIFSFVQILQNKPPSALKCYKITRKLNDTTSKFLTNSWDFSHNNTDKLWNELNDVDKELFNFEMNSINWTNYLTTFYIGIRKYLLKENSENMNYALRRYRRLKFYQKTTWTFMFVCIIYIIFVYINFKCLFK